jgi:kynurenine formamidase
MNVAFERIVDLSVAIEATPSERVPVSIRYVNHQEGAAEMCRIFGTSRADLPATGGWAGEEVRLISHAGTHVDAPWHYGPLSSGKPALKVDEVPLDWFIGPGVVLNVSHKKDATGITPDDLKECLERAHAELGEGTIVLLHTGASRYWGRPEYPEHGAGLTADAVLWLCQRRVRVIGTDAFSLDVPFEVMKEQFAATRDPAIIWPAHFAGHKLPYCQIEKLTNLDRLPAQGFFVACFPVKISRASAGWTRAVALVP